MLLMSTPTPPRRPSHVTGRKGPVVDVSATGKTMTIQRGGDPVRLMRVTAGHPAEPVMADLDVWVACRSTHPNIFTRSRLDDPFAP
jgi:hypothetical protein